jgi:hypothetical protein
MAGDTRLRRLKDSARKGPIYGDLKSANAQDHWPIEISESNRVTFNPEQSALRLALRESHGADVEWENLEPTWRTIKNKLTQEDEAVQITQDSQGFFLDIDSDVMSNQLTIEGESRKVMAGHDIAVSGIGQQEEPSGGLKLPILK